MFRPLFRILSLVVLLATFIGVSGILSTASALLDTDAVDVCCDTGSRDNSGSSLPCATPDCTCSLCMTTAVLTDSPVVSSRPVSSVKHVGLLLHRHLQEYLPSIDYPPEVPA